uniref:Synaptotagmin like 1 n=1 Tax=Serinus canaria TaxID=9135 RepID=A0A8C9N0E6_SERCA
MSLYSEGELGRVAVRGCVQFSLRYQAAEKELQVHVLRCRQLAEAKKQRSDPYIKTYLLPDKSNRSKRKTAVRKRSLDPVFNETLKYKLEKRDLQGRTLNLSVWHHDSLGRNLFLGEVEVALGTWDWANTRPEWFSLQPRMPIPSDGLASCGSLNLALKFIPAGSEGAGMPPTGELHIWVKDAQSLIPLQSGTVDAFVQCYVLPDDSKASRQKTRVVKRSLNPSQPHHGVRRLPGQGPGRGLRRVHPLAPRSLLQAPAGRHPPQPGHREQLRAARGLDGLDGRGAGRVAAAAAAARALGGGAAAPADQPGPPGVAPQEQLVPAGLWDLGGGLCPPLPAAMKWHRRAHLAAFYCCGHIWGLFIAPASILPLLWGWSCCSRCGAVPSSPVLQPPGVGGGHCSAWMSLFLLGYPTPVCPVPLGHPPWFPVTGGTGVAWGHPPIPPCGRTAKSTKVFLQPESPRTAPLLGLRGDNDTDTRNYRKILYWFLCPHSSSGSAQ